MPRRVKLATLIAFCLHGVLILTASYRLSYDAYNHMFFASHYQVNWWSLWEPRWYTGFEVISYPPLVHQLIALLGQVIGVDKGFALPPEGPGLGITFDEERARARPFRRPGLQPRLNAPDGSVRDF